MIAAFGTRPKQRLNRVMVALNFEYPDYERLNKGVEGQKRKGIVSVLSRAARMVEEEEEAIKKRKCSPDPKVAASKKRKATAPKPKTTEIEEILKVMTECLPIKLLCPLGPHLTKDCYCYKSY
jgi:hypothetical protein